MKILAFTDVHGSLKAIKKIAEKAKRHNPDIMICAGDISIFERGLEFLLHRLDKIGIMTLMIHGNHESEEELERASLLFKNIVFMHKRCLETEDAVFFGYGGGGFSLVDPGFKKLGKMFEQKAKEAKDKKIVLVTHAPPYNTKIDRISRNHCGNKTIRGFIDKISPDLVVSGHLHENSGKEDKIGKTKIINPGPYGKILMV